MKENDIDNLFREAFQDTEESPRADLWQNIEQELDASAEPIKLAKKKPFWYSFAAAAVLLMALGIGLKLMLQKDNITVKPSEKLIANIPQPTKKEQETKTEVQAEIEAPVEKIQKNALAVSNTEIKSNVAQPTKIEEQRKVVTIAELEEVPVELANINHTEKNELNIHQVTEIDDIKPLIEPEEEMESMLASANSDKQENKNIVTSILNTISDKIGINEKNNVRFSADDEGSFTINIINSIAKNRNKKRK